MAGGDVDTILTATIPTTTMSTTTTTTTTTGSRRGGGRGERIGTKKKNDMIIIIVMISSLSLPLALVVVAVASGMGIPTATVCHAFTPVAVVVAPRRRGGVRPAQSSGAAVIGRGLSATKTTTGTTTVTADGITTATTIRTTTKDTANTAADAGGIGGDRSDGTAPPRETTNATSTGRRAFLGTAAAAAALSGIVFSDGGNAKPASAATTTTTTTLSDAANAAAATTTAAVDWNYVFRKAGKRALGGGKAGASAAVVQVFSLMWLRTSMNYQYRYGGDLRSSLSKLWEEGGVGRLYQGLPFALIQGPLTRFGDTAANVGVLALLDSLDATRDLPLPLKTACGSLAAGTWRILLMPVDASKTSMQVEGSEGLRRLWDGVRKAGPSPLYRGALAQAAATAAGHFPWFLTYNFLDDRLPSVSSESDLLLSLGRSAALGFSASCVSDCVSNSLRVIKTTKQTALLSSPSANAGDVDATAVTATSRAASSSTTAAASTSTAADGTTIDSKRVADVYDAATTTAAAVIDDDTKKKNKENDGDEEKRRDNKKDDLSYGEVIAMIVEKDGLRGLFGRGLQTRLLTNAIQGALFSVMWKYFQQSGAFQ